MTSHYTNQASFIVLSHNNFILVLCLFQISKVTTDKRQAYLPTKKEQKWRRRDLFGK